jgi:hypothetical protein
MRFRPANIRLINRRSNLPRLLLALSSKEETNNDNNKNNPTECAELDGVTPYQGRRTLISFQVLCAKTVYTSSSLYSQRRDEAGCPSLA